MSLQAGSEIYKPYSYPVHNKKIITNIPSTQEFIYFLKKSFFVERE